MLGLQNEREWKLFCERVLEQPELAIDERFASNSNRTSAREALREVIVATFAKLSAAQVIGRLDRAGIANAQMNTLDDVWAHPQLKARERWQEVGTAAGAVPALLPPGLPTGFAPRMDPVPALGEHTEAILRELGYDSARIDTLRAACTI
jgi:crotonobetainyl-CoA:carnitine CoA-transferase CaiB-like acyl-CoA transferase